MSDRSKIKPSKGRAAFVTGGTDGIGKQIALGLSKVVSELLIVGRDAAKGAQAQREISAESRGCDVQFIRADLGLVREAERLGELVAERVPALHYLVHSAGVVRGRRIITDEGLESNFATNYLSRFVLTNRLLPALQADSQPGHPARILLIAHPGFKGTIHYDDVNLAGNYSMIEAFRQFHFANDVFAVELARHLDAAAGSPPVSIACLHPGPTKTAISREMPLWMKLLVRALVNPLISRKPNVAAEPVLKWLLADEFDGQPGAQFFSHVGKFRRIHIPDEAKDPQEGGRLWALSESKVRSALNGRITQKAA